MNDDPAADVCGPGVLVGRPAGDGGGGVAICVTFGVILRKDLNPTCPRSSVQ